MKLGFFTMPIHPLDKDWRTSLREDLSYDVAAADLIAVATTLRDEAELRFEILIDVAGVDYLDYGRDEWRTVTASSSGFGRAVNRTGSGGAHDGPRFAVIYQLLSVTHNERLTLRTFCADNVEPSIDSIVGHTASHRGR